MRRGNAPDSGCSLAWHHLRCQLPPDWEVTAYSIERRAGRIECCTRRGLAGALSWEPCRAEPDPLAAFRTLLREQHRAATDEAPWTRPAGAFTLCGLAPDAPCQALAFRPDTRCLLRWVFPSADPSDVDRVYLPLLASCEPNDDDPRRYAIFGLDLLLPAAYEIEEMHAYPANVTIGFESNRRRRVTLRRWGLPRHLLGGRSLDTFYATFLEAQGTRMTQTAPAGVGPYPAVLATYAQRGQHQLERYLGRLWRDGQAVLWHAVDEQRLYAFEQIGPRGSAPLDLRDVVGLALGAPPPSPSEPAA